MKVYTKMYSVDYASIAKADPPLIVYGSTMACFAIPFPSEGFMERVVINQAPTDNPQVAATAELLDSRIPFPPGEYATSATPASTINHFRILPTPLTINLGSVGEMNEDEFGIAFRNIDGGYTANQRVIYLLIKPTGATAETNWNVTLVCRTDVG